MAGQNQNDNKLLLTVDIGIGFPMDYKIVDDRLTSLLDFETDHRFPDWIMWKLLKHY
ncbi:hypothetical protein HDV02_006002, partial [Globomyces sp. JEL0801]